eukprot:CAMPEP_0171192644 /NCGR_PEP_ID=MMETSP0790-20130122/19975_1 /TAXON_ID=2925 /ORGANISM="Alexandrium catenella, Strain OF101" /LENGTH=131 /DNA_ID=CAMNT_0011657807 /DNA_START=71 /DNA_END=466 /DNA_ORIENTATION=-
MKGLSCTTRLRRHAATARAASAPTKPAGAKSSKYCCRSVAAKTVGASGAAGKAVGAVHMLLSKLHVPWSQTQSVLLTQETESPWSIVEQKWGHTVQVLTLVWHSTIGGLAQLPPSPAHMPPPQRHSWSSEQ